MFILVFIVMTVTEMILSHKIGGKSTKIYGNFPGQSQRILIVFDVKNDENAV